MILAGDVGGTKTHLALFEPGGSPRKPRVDRKFPSREHPSLEAIARSFLNGVGARPSRAVFGIAGPVVDNRAEATNLPWVMDGRALGEAIGGAPVTLMNDLEATAWGLSTLEPRDLEVLQRGQPTPGNRALIAAGTGLGEAIALWDGEHWRPTASEGGHTDFGPRDTLEDELLSWLRDKYGRVSYERILSGPGLSDLYRFMSESGRGAEPPEVRRRFAEAADPATVVTQTALDRSCERSVVTVTKFLEIYGAEAGNLALKALAVSGVYVGGGIAPRMMPLLRAGGFLGAFKAKGRLSPVLEKIPLAVILDSHTALWGAAACALSAA